MSTENSEKLALIASTLDTVAKDTAIAKDTVMLVQSAMESLALSSRDGSTASMKMATIMEEREKRAAIADEAALVREEKLSDQKGKVWRSVADNWKIVLLGLALFLNPASLGKLYELGLLAPLGVPAPTAVAAVMPAPVAAPVSLPVQPAVSEP